MFEFIFLSFVINRSLPFNEYVYRASEDVHTDFFLSSVTIDSIYSNFVSSPKQQI